MAVWSSLAGLLLLGYLCMGRSFAYLGVPPVFIGEIVLAAFLLFKPRVVLGTWVASLLRASPLNALGLAMLVFVLYGIWQVARGVLGGTSIFYTLKFFIFNYYIVYLLCGIWIGLQAPEFLSRLIRRVAWVHAIYGILYISVLKHVGAQLPGSGVALFGTPGGGAVVILGLLCFERDLRAVAPVLALNIAVTLGIPARSVWLGLAVGMLVWGLLTGRFGRVIAMGVAGLAVVGMIELAGIRLGSVSFGDIAGRIIAPMNPEVAEQLSPNAKFAAGTVEWRQKWWEQIWLSVHSTPMLQAFGHGYGFDLFALAPEDVRTGQVEEIRTPHSVFYFALGYTGWVGVALFSVLQFTILRLVWRTFRRCGQPAGVVWWVMGIGMSFFEASFDSPYKAIPFYLLMGFSIAPGLQTTGERHARPARAQLLPAAGR